MRARYLLPLALLICLAVAPTALARNNEHAPGQEPAACVHPSDADADNVSEEDLCETEEGAAGEGGTPAGEGGAPAGEGGAPAGEGGAPNPCEPAPAPGANAGEEPGETPEGEDPPADEAAEGDASAEDAGYERLLPFESGREYRDFCEMPDFDRGFLRRTWRFGGDATSFGDGVLTMIIGSAPRVPARFREQAGRLVGLEVAVLVGRRTRLVSPRSARGSSRRGRRGSARRVAIRALQRAGRVRVEGKLLHPSRWRQDANGQRIPTIRATKVTIGN